MMLHRAMLDTHIIVWAIDRDGVPEWTTLVDQSRRLIAELIRLRISVILPTPIVTEIISGCATPERRDYVRQEVNSNFYEDVSFDMEMADLAGVLIGDAYAGKR